MQRTLPLVALMFYFIVSARSQQILSRQITIEAENVTLEDLFSQLERENDIVFVYGVDNIPRSLRVTIKAHGQPLLKVIENVCSQAELTYQVVDNAIWLKYISKPRLARPKSNANPADTLHVGGEIMDSSVPIMGRGHHGDSLLFVRTPRNILSEPIEVGKPDLNLRQVVVEPVRPSRREKRIVGYGLFAYYGIDYNQFQFTDRAISFEEYSVDPNYSFAIGAYVVTRSRFFVSIGIGYATKDFTLSYNYKILDPDDPFPIPNKTNLSAHYLEVPITFGYIFLKRRRLDFCAGGGFYPSRLVAKSESTSYLNAKPKETEHFVNEHESMLFSATVGLILNYRPLKRVGIFCEPEYLYVVTKVNSTAIDSNANMFRVKAGIQIALQK